ncbi:MAG: multidrug ABC transporter [Oscillospiraceae bacterium]|nr:multidrug ABC transporter [Oscillospiraceae bacterium]
MDNMIPVYVLIAMVGVFLSSVSQVLLKKAAMRQYDSFIQEYLNPLVISAYILFLAATFVAVYAYKGIPLSLGPILEATSYIYITIWGISIFHEKTDKNKLIALGLIICGIMIYTLFG